jgi:hypothetical protein
LGKSAVKEVNPWSYLYVKGVAKLIWSDTKSYLALTC